MEQPQKGGIISIRLATGGLQVTKADTPGDGVVADGGGIYVDGGGNPDLVILIASNTTGDIVATYPNSGRSGVVNGICTTHTNVDAVLSFDFRGDQGPDAGEYTVYAFCHKARPLSDCLR